MNFPGDPYFKFLALKQYGPPPDQEQQALLISGLPSALKIIIRSYGNPTVIRLGTCILNNLSSLGGFHGIFKSLYNNHSIDFGQL